MGTVIAASTVVALERDKGRSHAKSTHGYSCKPSRGDTRVCARGRCDPCGAAMPMMRGAAMCAMVCSLTALIGLSGAIAAVAPDTLSPALHRPIASVLAEARDGDEVVVRGVVREQTGDSTYIIEDRSGNAHVRVPDALLTGAIVLAAGTTVEIRGRVRSTPVQGYRIEAQQATVLRASDAPFAADDVLIR